MRERDVAKVLVDEAKTAGILIRKCRWEGRVGAPDYLVAYRGRVVFIETKAPGEKPRASQNAEFAAIRAAGVAVCVVDSPEAAQAAIHAMAGEDTCRKVVT